jgi:adenylosuccinate synthase
MVRAVVGAQWGDEGKGKIVDILASRADVVVRAQGGNNAGHTVKVNDKVYKLHLIPSGILYPDKLCLVGCGTVIDPKVILEEIDTLMASGCSMKNLRIDPRAHVIMPYHIALDKLSEIARGKGDIGTTGRGIGPCYMDKAERCGIRMSDLIDTDVFSDRVRNVLPIKNAIIEKVYGGTGFEAKDIIDEYSEYAKRLAPFVDDASVLLYDAIKEGKNVLLEGAQGTLLDLDMGTYPYVTSSHPVSGGFSTGTGVGPTYINEVIGVEKAYTTRVGKGPFPTELEDEVGNAIREKGFEYGTTTGRPRRCGWLDAVILRQAVKVNGLTAIALNKIDTLAGIAKLKICTAYKAGDKILESFPATLKELEKCQPVYVELDGFEEDISACKTYDELPKNVKNYISVVEKLCDCPVKMIGVGPDREQNIER